jgi:hypothetical protein
MIMKNARPLTLLATVFVALLSVATAAAQTLPSETPAEFKPTNYGFDHIRRDVMIPKALTSARF